MAAAHFNPPAPIFDLSRTLVLSSPTPPIQIANELSNSMTRSTYRLHWNWLAVWENFGTLVQQYWNNVVPQVDKQANVFTQGEYINILYEVATDERVANEGAIKGRIQAF